MPRIEYRVRPVTRYIVTRWEEGDDGRSGSVCDRGEYDNAHVAHEVGCALAKADQDRLGYPPGDMRIIYPEPLIVAPDGFPDSFGIPKAGRRAVAAA